MQSDDVDAGLRVCAFTFSTLYNMSQELEYSFCAIYTAYAKSMPYE
jgi:hypothetical protein